MVAEPGWELLITVITYNNKTEVLLEKPKASSSSVCGWTNYFNIYIY